MTRTAPRLRAAIAGAGLMGRWHADAAARAGAEVTAVVDPDPARAERLASRYRTSRVCPALGEALPMADVVHLCTPPDTHESLARAALEAGRDVLVEKPLAASAAATTNLLDLAAAHGVRLCPVYQFLSQDGVREAMTARDAIGPLLHVAFAICSAGADGQNAATRDRVAREILPHPASLLIRLSPGRWQDAEWSVRTDAAGEIRALAECGGVTTSLLISMSGRPTRNQLELVGARGSCLVDLFHGYSVVFGGAASRGRKIVRPFVESSLVSATAASNLARRAVRRETAYPGLRPLVAQFYEAVASGGEPPISRGETLAVAETCDRVSDQLTRRR